MTTVAPAQAGAQSPKESAMCPACLAAMGLYVLGAASAGAGTTVLATQLLRKRAESNPSTQAQGDDHAKPDRRIEK